jgi:hypothetical protein
MEEEEIGVRETTNKEDKRNGDTFFISFIIFYIYLYVYTLFVPPSPPSDLPHLIKKQNQ